MVQRLNGTPTRSQDIDHDSISGPQPSHAGRTQAPASTARRSAPAAPGDSFESSQPPPRAAIRHGVFANSPPPGPNRENMTAFINAMRDFRIPPTAVDHVGAPPESLESIRARQRDEAFREGAIATGAAVLEPLAAAGGAHFAHEAGSILAATVVAQGHAALEVHGGAPAVQTMATDQVGVAAGFGAEQLMGEGEHFLGAAAGVALSGARLTLEATAHGLEQADELRDGAERLGQWQRRRDAAAHQDRESQNDGNRDARHADFSGSQLPPSIDQERMLVDGAYARAVINTIQFRASQHRY